MIFVECKADEVLVRTLTGLPRREVIHELKGKPEVVKKVSEHNGSKGMVDEDPQATQPRYLKLMEVVRDLDQRGLRLLGDARDNRIVLLRPRLEDWVKRAAQDAGVPLADYSLPDDPERLHQVINVDLRKFERLANALTGCDRFTALRDLLMG